MLNKKRRGPTLNIFLTVFLPLALVVIMFSLGLGLTVEDFQRVLRRPKAFGIGAASQLFLVPAAALLIVMAFDLPPAIALGVMILSFCPGGATSNILTRLAGGDLALSISLTGLISLISVITLPVFVTLAASLLLDDAAPPPVVPLLGIALFLLMAVPVGAGMAIRVLKPALSASIEAPMHRIANILFGAVVIGAVATNWALLVENLVLLGPALVTLNIVLLVCGFLLAGLLRLNTREAKAIAIETGIQNAALGINVGILLSGQVAELPAYSLASGVYGVAMYFVSLPFVLWLRSR